MQCCAVLYNAVLTDLRVAGGLVHHQVEGLECTKGQEQVLDLQQGSRGRSAGMGMAELLATCSVLCQRAGPEAYSSLYWGVCMARQSTFRMFAF